MEPEDFAHEQVELWPENWEAYCLFAFLGTQWRYGMSGPVGLDFSVLHRELDDLGLSGDDRQRMKHDIRAMEAAALEEIHTKR
ncbi:DUF1799 domain-containing protein [uncultured Ramlibacter sp.]|uniref:DUF1799 domain-containing protein n=1 Tax=uncultured Ramlibacter sp. TaxID=260755 RepID=UPI00260EAB1E|nr:DUF1799 domain-containing protein [uncultured Ramlibacter sp.]